MAKFIITSDWHFGVYKSEMNKWLGIMTEYFEYFIAHIKETYEPGDELIILGDIFHDQASVDNLARYTAEQIIVRLAAIIPVHILVGNHDMWAKNSVKVSSVNLLRYVPNVHLYETPTVKIVCGRTCLFLPWFNTKEEEIIALKTYKADILFMHSDMVGAKSTVRKDLSPEKHKAAEMARIRMSSMPSQSDFALFKKAFSGHIHISQEIGNVIFVGNPYHMDWNDCDNTKGHWVVNADSLSAGQIPNNISPKFRICTVNNIDDIDNAINTFVKKDWVDLYISEDITSDTKNKKKINELQKLDFMHVYVTTGKEVEIRKAEALNEASTMANIIMTPDSIYELALAMVQAEPDDEQRSIMTQQLDKGYKIWSTTKTAS